MTLLVGKVNGWPASWRVPDEEWFNAWEAEDHFDEKAQDLRPGVAISLRTDVLQVEQVFHEASAYGLVWDNDPDNPNEHAWDFDGDVYPSFDDAERAAEKGCDDEDDVHFAGRWAVVRL